MANCVGVYMIRAGERMTKKDRTFQTHEVYEHLQPCSWSSGRKEAKTTELQRQLGMWNSLSKPSKGGGRTELNLAITTGEGDRGLHAQVLIFDKRSNKEPMLRLRSSWTGCQLCFRLEQSSKPGLYTYEPWQALFRASLACSLTVRIKKKQDREC